MTGFRLRLFVAGRTPRAETAVDNLRELCERQLGDGSYKLEIIDVLENPELAEEERILMTPTLVKSVPLPVRRIVGDLSDAEAVARALGFRKQHVGGTHE